jgi:hypothetical protein
MALANFINVCEEDMNPRMHVAKSSAMLVTN